MCPENSDAKFFIQTFTTFSSSTTTTNNLIIINSRSWCNGWSNCLQYYGEWYCYPVEALDETPVEICKADENFFLLVLMVYMYNVQYIGQLLPLGLTKTPFGKSYTDHLSRSILQTLC